MQDNQTAILTEIKTLIDTVTDFKFVGDFPDSVQLIGNKYPAVLVGCGEETFELGNGGRIESEFFIPIYLYSNVNQSRLTTILSLQNKIIAVLEESLNLNGKALLIQCEGSEKGEYSTTPDKYSIGWYPNLSVIKLNFKVNVCYTRT